MENRRLLLGGLVAALVPAFAATHAIIGLYKDQRQELAREWHARADAASGTDPRAAVVDYETSVSYDDAPDVRLKLAEALMAADRRVEATAQLESLWTEQPGNGEINIDLARLAAADGDVASATRYYHIAVDGAWDHDQAAQRREARLELAQFLLAKGQKTGAQSELIAMMDSLPPNAPMLTTVGALLVRAGADRRALDLFGRALAIDPSDGEAAALAGEVQFHAGDYRSADRYFSMAAAHMRLDDDARWMAEVSGRVLALDPDVPRIPARERARRVLQAVGVAQTRLAACGAATNVDAATATRIGDLSTQAAAASKLRATALEHDTDLSEQTMSLVFDIEDLPAQVCGPGSADDQALQLIGKARRASAR